jgi:protoporphyrinogen oxidase
MKIAVLGAGVSGIVISKMLCDYHDVDVFEQSDTLSGIAKVRMIDGLNYHICGGHGFNSNHQEVLDWVFSQEPETNWTKKKRRFRVQIGTNQFDYPIEYSIRQINDSLGTDVAAKIIREVAKLDPMKVDPTNLDTWFESTFGATLTELYFRPYNTKVWNRDIRDMSSGWTQENKLPTPDPDQIIKSLFETQTDDMPLRYVYYHASGNQNAYLENMAKSLFIRFNTKVRSVKKSQDGKFLVNGEQYDKVINTLPLDIFPSIYSPTPDLIHEFSEHLVYNKVSTLFWRGAPLDTMTTYFPDKHIRCFRHTHVGNWRVPSVPCTVTEAIGEVSREDLIKDGKQFHYLKEPLDYHVSKHAYIVNDHKTHDIKGTMLNYFESQGVHMLGRFAEWNYYNMDMCIYSALQLARKFNVQP